MRHKTGWGGRSPAMVTYDLARAKTEALGGKKKE